MKRLLPLATLLLAGCGTVPLTHNQTFVAGKQAPGRLMITRENEVFAMGATLYVGKSEQYFAKLEPGQYIAVNVDPGTYDLQVKGWGTPSFTRQVMIAENQTVCLEGSVNDTARFVFMIPILGMMTNTFVLDPVECPSTLPPAGYKPGISTLTD